MTKLHTHWHMWMWLSVGTILIATALVHNESLSKKKNACSHYIANDLINTKYYAVYCGKFHNSLAPRYTMQVL